MASPNRDKPYSPSALARQRGAPSQRACQFEHRNYETQQVRVSNLRTNPRNARTHSKKQVAQIVSSIREFGFTSPVLIDEAGELIAGEGRYKAAMVLGLKNIPAITIAGLSQAKKQALALADNKIALNAGWNRERLALELGSLPELLAAESLDVSITGFEAAEIDVLLTDFEPTAADPADTLNPSVSAGPPITRRGDLWQLGKHKLICDDARNAAELGKLMQGERAQMAFLDPPYNVAVKSIGGRGKIKHAEFAMASGEMSSEGFQIFLRESFSAAVGASVSGAVHYVCIDWRHVDEVIASGRATYGEMLNIVAWVKSNAGQGSFYRSQHEFVVVFRCGSDGHLNNIELGRHGRSRSNVWHYAGANTFRTGRMDDLRVHPTVKPVAMVADAIKDCTRRDDIVLDTFGGSGTTILAAERVGRCGYCIEIEPRYVDVAIRRWQAFTGKDAIHVSSGLAFDDIQRDGSGLVGRQTGQRDRV
jgi:DNA modification methylase